MHQVIGVGVYLLLGLVIAVSIIAVLRNLAGKAGSVAATDGMHVPLAALAEIAEEVHRHNQLGQHALPWTIPSALVPLATETEGHKAASSLEEICERLDVIETRLGLISMELKKKTGSVFA